MLYCLILGTLGQYMLIGNPEPPRQPEPTNQVEVERASEPGWHKITPLMWLNTRWVWGTREPDTGKIVWDPEDQPAAWDRIGKRMPDWVKADDSGRDWHYWDSRVLEEYVGRVNRQLADNRARRAARAAAPVRPTASVVLPRMRDWTAACIGSS